MNMLTVATIDFINHLRAATVGWRIEPAILLRDATANDQIIDIIKPPQNTSFTNFFINQDKHPLSIITIIRIKIKRQQLTYFIQCKLIIDRKPMLELSYWRGIGWLRTTEPTLARYKRSASRFKDHECSDDKISYHVYKIDRVKKGTKSKGAKRPGTPNTIYCDRIDLSDPEAARIVAERAVFTLTNAQLIKLSNSTYSSRHVYVYTNDNPEEITDTHTWKQATIQYVE